jgi:succinate dehydrogenase / fumarate reductase iron-sulfur subunit
MATINNIPTRDAASRNAKEVCLPQGQPQCDERTLAMVTAMRNELFGSCTNHGECEAMWRKQIPMKFIGKMNRDLMRAVWHRRREPLVIPSIVQVPMAEDTHEHFHDAPREVPPQLELPEHAGARS